MKNTTRICYALVVLSHFHQIRVVFSLILLELWYFLYKLSSRSAENDRNKQQTIIRRELNSSETLAKRDDEAAILLVYLYSGSMRWQTTSSEPIRLQDLR